MKMEQSVPKRRVYKIQTPGNYREENIQHTEHGESLKSRVVKSVYRAVRTDSLYKPDYVSSLKG